MLMAIVFTNGFLIAGTLPAISVCNNTAEILYVIQILVTTTAQKRKKITMFLSYICVELALEEVVCFHAEKKTDFK